MTRQSDKERDGTGLHSMTPARAILSVEERRKITLLTLQRHKAVKQKTVLVTAYDYPQALLAGQAGIDVIVVGDSIGMTTFGYKTTIPVKMEEMIPQCKAVWRANTKAFVVGDMPFMTYQASNAAAIRNAGRFIQDGACDAIKVEGAMIDRVKAIVDAGIVVMSHLGLTPQTRTRLGGYRVQGKTKEQTDIILNQALKLQEAGCSLLLLEAMPRESAGFIASQLKIPVYGIGAGNLVDGQLVIMHDLIGMFFEFKSKFVKRYCEAGKMIQEALVEYASEVRNCQFPTQEHFYEINDEELEKLMSDDNWKYMLEEVNLKRVRTLNR